MCVQMDVILPQRTTGQIGMEGKTRKGKYPTLYLLHGLTDDHKAWPERGGIQTVLDELTGTGEAVPMVVVMPRAGDADTHRYQSGYFNVRNWSYEDFFFQELIPAVESKYRCGGAKARRAVSGLSMGGGASVAYCQRHPDMFSSCYAMSPWLDNKKNEVGMPADKEDRLYLKEARTFRFAFLPIDAETLSVEAAVKAIVS